MEVCYNYNSHNSHNSIYPSYEGCVDREYKEYRPYNMCNLPKDLNIIGMYKLKKTKIDVKNAPWANFKNVVQQCERVSNRDKGFSILSDRKNVISYLKNTKFCKLKIETGECCRDVCNFAHSVRDIIFPICAFENSCSKKDTCMFRHLDETIEDYKRRINFVIPTNIS